MSVATSASCGAGWTRATAEDAAATSKTRGAAPAALDIAKNIPTGPGRTRPEFFPRKNASGQGKDGDRWPEKEPCERSDPLAPSPDPGHGASRTLVVADAAANDDQITTIIKGREGAGWSPVSLMRPRSPATPIRQSETYSASAFFLSPY